jgi:hypothetical protein
MVHLDAEKVAVAKGDLSISDFTSRARRAVVEAGGKEPEQKCVRRIVDILARLDEWGDDLVPELDGRVIAEALETVPVELGSNPPEVPIRKGPTLPRQRAFQRTRLGMIVGQRVEDRMRKQGRYEAKAEARKRTDRAPR